MFQTRTFGTEKKHITGVGFLPVSYVQQLSQFDNLNLARAEDNLEKKHEGGPWIYLNISFLADFFE
jgi:hypothetical protein